MKLIISITRWIELSESTLVALDHAAKTALNEEILGFSRGSPVLRYNRSIVPNKLSA